MPHLTKIISWNLLRLTGATVEEVAGLARRERPDLLLLQEATTAMNGLTGLLGGFYARVPLPGRIHGLAMWSPGPLPAVRVLHLPSGALVDRLCQIVDLRHFAVANVHLSHGQLLNRRQLRHIAAHLPARAAVLGDYNLVGPALLPGFRDVGRGRPRMYARMWYRCGWTGVTCGGWRVRARMRWTGRGVTIGRSWCGWGRGWSGWRREGRKSPFLKERTKKLLSVLSQAQWTKVFCFFFLKKKACLP